MLEKYHPILVRIQKAARLRNHYLSRREAENSFERANSAAILEGFRTVIQDDDDAVVLFDGKTFLTLQISKREMVDGQPAHWHVFLWICMSPQRAYEWALSLGLRRPLKNPPRDLEPKRQKKERPRRRRRRRTLDTALAF